MSSMQIKARLLFAWGEERISPLDDILSILPAWSGFDATNVIHRPRGNLLWLVGYATYGI